MRSGDITFSQCNISRCSGGWAALLVGFIVFSTANACAEEMVKAVEPVTESILKQAEELQPEPGVQPSTEQPPAEQPPATVPEPTLLETMDAPRDYLSEKIVTFTKQVDQFFGDERYYQEYNKSVIQLELHETFAQGGGHTFGFAGKAKLDLPAAEKRFHFVLESNPEKKTAGEVKKDQPATAKEPATPEQYAASLRYEKSDDSRWHFSSDAGIKFQLPLNPFLRTRGSYAIQFEEWRLKVAETIFWFSTIGLGETTQFDMERVLSAPVLFRATSTATCLSKPYNCDLRQDLSLFHTLDDRSAVIYQTSVIGVSKPVLQETAYVLLMRYRYRLHKEWVFFEISPQLNFPKTDDFRLNALLQLRLEMLFGGTK